MTESVERRRASWDVLAFLMPLFVAAVVGVVVAADALSDSDEASAEVAVSDGAADEVAAADDGRESVVDLVVADPRLSALAAALPADVVETLDGEGPFTVLAPTDEAFTEALDALGLSLEDLLADQEMLSAILSYHVIPGELSAEEARDAGEATTLQGEVVRFDRGISRQVWVNGFNGGLIVDPDLDADNGIVHVIDGVLLPPSMTETDTSDPGADAGNDIADPADDTGESDDGSGADVADSADRDPGDAGFTSGEVIDDEGGGLDQGTGSAGASGSPVTDPEGPVTDEDTNQIDGPGADDETGIEGPDDLGDEG